MGNRTGLPILTAQSMAVSTSYEYSLSNNYGAFIAIDWSGQVGTGKIKIQASIDGIVWCDYPFNNVGTVVTEISLTGATGTKGIEINEFFPDKIKIVYTADTATAGTVNAKMTIIDKQEVH